MHELIKTDSEKNPDRYNNLLKIIDKSVFNIMPPEEWQKRLKARDFKISVTIDNSLTRGELILSDNKTVINIPISEIDGTWRFGKKH
jgi:hypothetical protein